MTCTIDKLKIKKQSSFDFQVELQDENDCDKPLNLTGFTGATAYFSGDNDTTVAVSGTLTTVPETGELSFSMSQAVTSTLLEGDENDMEVVAEYNGRTAIAEYIGKVQVLPRRF
jgi:hypothetical protein